MISDISPEIHEKFKRIRLLALDSDGVLTDGGVYLFEDGQEFRRFDIKDGLGLKRAYWAGMEIAIISSGSCEAVRARAAGLGIHHVYLGVQDKLLSLQKLCRNLEINLDQVAFVGDDLPDIPVLKVVGIACAPADAIKEVRASAGFVSSKPGGAGAVREICDLLVEGRLPGSLSDYENS